MSGDERPPGTDGIEDERPLTEEFVTYSSTPAGGKTQQVVDSGRIGTSAHPGIAGTESDSDRQAGDPAAETENSGDLARSALAGAQRIARGGPGSRSGRRRSARRKDADGRSPGGYSGPAPDESDPQRIGGLLADYVAERGWERPLSEARVFSDWAALVGADVAAHCAPTALTGGELKVTAESTAWATQLRLLSAALLARLVAELGPDVVTSIRISGPAGPSWKHGGFSVRGARGPRDTYG